MAATSKRAAKRATSKKTSPRPAQAQPPPCPACTSLDVVPIAYGLPGRDMEEDEEAGKLVLGGCCVNLNSSPAWHCRACDKEFGRVGMPEGMRRGR